MSDTNEIRCNVLRSFIEARYADILRLVMSREHLYDPDDIAERMEQCNELRDESIRSVNCNLQIDIESIYGSVVRVTGDQPRSMEIAEAVYEDITKED